MDPATLEELADFICGDDLTAYPVYRTGADLTRFFQRAGVPRLVHDGSTRKWWVLESLRQTSGAEKGSILCRLASPKEYGGDIAKLRMALTKLNAVLRVEDLKMEIVGGEPKIARLKVADMFDAANQPDLKPLPPPDFSALGLEAGLGALLADRWTEAQRCVDASAYLAALIMMGSLLEGMLLGVIRRNMKAANQAGAAPRGQDGSVLLLKDWKLAQMIEVAHELRWLGLDIKKFSHALREFRNLVHPHQQLAVGDRPDGDTCRISWLVVQAAANDLAKILHV